MCPEWTVQTGSAKSEAARNEPVKPEARKRADAWQSLFMPSGALVGVRVDTRHWSAVRIGAARAGRWAGAIMEIVMHRLALLAAIIGLSLNVLSAGAQGGQPADPADCAAIEADAARLACYDALFRKAAPGDPPAAQPTAAKTEAEAEGKFGLTLRALTGSSQLERLTSRITDISKRGKARPVLTLENGQHWSLIEAIDFDYFRTGDQITIRPAAMGSFLAKKEGLNRTVRVRRID